MLPKQTLHNYKHSSSTLPYICIVLFPGKWEIYIDNDNDPCFFARVVQRYVWPNEYFSNLDFPEIIEDFPNPKSCLFSPKKMCVRSRWNLTRLILPCSKIRTKQVEPRKISSYQAKPRKEVSLKTIVGKLGFSVLSSIFRENNLHGECMTFSGEWNFHSGLRSHLLRDSAQNPNCLGPEPWRT